MWILNKMFYEGDKFSLLHAEKIIRKKMCINSRKYLYLVLNILNNKIHIHKYYLKLFNSSKKTALSHGLNQHIWGLNHGVKIVLFLLFLNEGNMTVDVALAQN